MTYTPQSPTALSNDTTIIEAQIETIVNIVAKLDFEGAKSIEPRQEAEIEWKKSPSEMANHTLFPYTSCCWDGGNIPGKKAVGMTYIAGINQYEKQCRATTNDWSGFEVVVG
jgi:hypothetical protein